MADYDFQFGVIKVDGSKDHGSSGWRSQAMGVGNYRITFTNRFEDTPTITVTPERTESSALRAPITPEVVLTQDRLRRTQIDVVFRGTTGIPHSTQFNFIAIAED